MELLVIHISTNLFSFFPSIKTLTKFCQLSLSSSIDIDGTSIASSIFSNTISTFENIPEYIFKSHLSSKNFTIYFFDQLSSVGFESINEIAHVNVLSG